MGIDNLELSNRIWKFNETKALGLSTLSVYFYLLKISVERESLKFTVSDSQISRQLKMTRKTVKVCKEKLRRFGIIYYQSMLGIPTEVQLLLEYPIILEIENVSDELSKAIKRNKQVKKVPVKSKILKTSIIEIDSDKSSISKDFPTLEEFLEYAQTIETYDTNLSSEIQNKYQTWVNNGWKNNFDRPITNWKSALKNSLPYLKNNAEKSNKSIHKIPSIKRIKIENDL